MTQEIEHIDAKTYARLTVRFRGMESMFRYLAEMMDAMSNRCNVLASELEFTNGTGRQIEKVTKYDGSVRPEKAAPPADSSQGE